MNEVLLTLAERLTLFNRLKHRNEVVNVTQKLDAEQLKSERKPFKKTQ